jgi:hypothetical protein
MYNWLRRYGTIQKVAGSIHNVSDLSIRKSFLGLKGPTGEDHGLAAIYELIIYKMWELRRFTPVHSSTAGYRDSILIRGNTVTAMCRQVNANISESIRDERMH